MGGHGLGDAGGVVGDHDEPDQRVELELVERVPGRLLDPGHLFPGALGRHVGRRLRTTRAVAQVGVDADDVGVLGGEGEDPLAAATDDERRPRLLHRPGEQRVLVHLVVAAVEGERAVGAEQPLDDLHRLFEALDPDPWRVVREARLFVVGLHPSGAEAELEAALAQDIERGRFLGQHEGVPVVVAEDERAQAQRGGGGGHGGQGRHRGQLVAEVVGHEQGGVARGPRHDGPARPTSGPCRRGPCSSWAAKRNFLVMCHARMVPHRARRAPVDQSQQESRQPQLAQR